VADYGLTVLSSKKTIAELSQSIQKMMSNTDET
jgi:hypothetical protein